VFTLEASFFGYEGANKEKVFFGISDLKKIGADICINLHGILKEEREGGNS
jgi:hypothetical protein